MANQQVGLYWQDWIKRERDTTLRIGRIRFHEVLAYLKAGDVAGTLGFQLTPSVCTLNTFVFQKEIELINCQALFFRSCDLQNKSQEASRSVTSHRLSISTKRPGRWGRDLSLS